MIISVLNFKGGSGKTTIATNLTYAFSRIGRTLLIDTDKQRSSMVWYDFRMEHFQAMDWVNFNAISITEVAALKKQLPMFRRDYETIIVDGAPQVDALNAACILGADVVLIPIMPSPLDVWASETIVQRIESIQEYHPVKAAWIINRDNPQTRLSGEVTAALKELPLQILSSRLRSRIVYADAMQNGLSVLESRNAAAVEEFENLYKEICEVK